MERNVNMPSSNISGQKYLVLVKLNPSKTEAFFNGLSSLSSTPAEGVTLNSAYNVFGEWDMAIWFEANSNDDAVHFVGEKIRSMEGVIETITMPATVIKDYRISSSSMQQSM